MMAPDAMLELLKVMVSQGALGVFCWWLMTRMETQLKELLKENKYAADRNREAMDRQSRAVLLLLIEVPNIPASTQHQAKSLIEEIDRVNIRETAPVRGKGE